MKAVFGVVGGIIGSLILIFAISLGADYFIGLKWYSFIEPKKEDVRREIFLNTRSYNEGKTQDLIRYRLEYLRSDEEGKAILSEAMRHMFAEFDENKLPLELKSFLQKIKYGELQQ